MPDISHLWGEDIQTSASGDLLAVDGDDLTIQRILRRLMTASQAYIWNLNYGGDVPARVGQTLDIPAITAVIRSQIALEATVARSPAPAVTVSEILNGVSVTVLFYSATTGQQSTLSFDVNG